MARRFSLFRRSEPGESAPTPVEDTGESKGFGFVEMSTDAEANAAIEGLNGKDFEGRPMQVNEARPQQKRPGGGGGGRGGYGGGGGGRDGGGRNRW